jgi:hypothetical protein
MMQIEETVLAIRAPQCLGARCLEQEAKLSLKDFTTAGDAPAHDGYKGVTEVSASYSPPSSRPER